MDIPITVDKWMETMTDSSNVPDRLPSLLNELASASVHLKQSPYSPQAWLIRARCLSDLKCRELADGDVVRCISLKQSILRVSAEHPGYRLGARCGFWMADDSEATTPLASSLKSRLLQIHEDALDVSHDHGGEVNFYRKRDYTPRQYPWLSAVHRGRSDDLICQINQELAESTAKVSESIVPSCMVRRKALNIHYADQVEILGIFAVHDLSANTLLLVDDTSMIGCANQPQLVDPGRKKKWSQCCVDAHTPLNLLWIHDQATSAMHAADVILVCQFLLKCFPPTDDHKNPVASVIHPLDHSLIARLTASYRGITSTSRHDRRAHGSSFTIQDDIQIPWLLLQTKGIDIYTDDRFETWVLFTLRARIRSNRWGEGAHAGVHPLFSLFNHSCEPNLKWGFVRDPQLPRFMRLETTREVGAGEQLFVNYDQYTDVLDLQERRNKLRIWLNRNCTCTRCLREEGEQSQRIQAGQPMSQPTWDIEAADRPTLPDDVVDDD